MIIPLYQLVLLYLPLVNAQTLVNQTAVPLSDTTQITRSGSGWTDNTAKSLISPLLGATGKCEYIYTRQVGDSVTFNFTGVAIYIGGNVTNLDRSNGHATVDGVEMPATSGPASGEYCDDILWALTGLPDTLHTVVVTSTEVTSGQQVLALAEMWYTTPKRNRNFGAVAGAAGGASIGVLIVAYFHGHSLCYYINYLIYFLFGWLLFTRRKFIFTLDPDVGPVEITLFLSKHRNIEDSDGSEKETLLAWRVIKLVHSGAAFTAFCPCGRGKTKLGFGTVEDTDKIIKSPDSAQAPAAWDGDEWSGLESKLPAVRNNGDVAKAFTLGTYEKAQCKLEFKPFLLINDLPPGESYEAETDLFLHACLTNGIDEGQYGERLVEAVMEDMLTKNGIRISGLKPVSQWHLHYHLGELVLECIKGNTSRDEDEV